jgi:hypothetical protein
MHGTRVWAKRIASPSSCPALCRASTSLRYCNKQDVDGRNKSGHDVATRCLSLVMPGPVPGIHVFTTLQQAKTWMAGTSPAMTTEMHTRSLHRHARPCAGHPCLYDPATSKTWMAGTSPAVTTEMHTRSLHRHARPCAGHPRLTALQQAKRGWPEQVRP